MQQAGAIVTLTKPRDAGSSLKPLTLPEARKAAVTMEAWHTGREWLFNTPPAVRTQAKAAIPALEAMLQPASRKDQAVVMDKLLAFAGALGKLSDAKAAVTVWVEALADLPPDLLMEAVTKTIRSHKFNTLPAPGEIRAHVAEKLARRKRALHIARTA